MVPVRLLLEVVVSVRCWCWCWSPIHGLCVRLLSVLRLGPLSPFTVMQDDVQGVDDTGNMTQQAEQYINEDVGATTAADEDGDGWEDDGEDDDQDI